MARGVLKQYPASLKILLRSYQSSEQLNRYRFCESASEVVATSPASRLVPKIAASRFTLSPPFATNAIDVTSGQPLMESSHDAQNQPAKGITSVPSLRGA